MKRGLIAILAIFLLFAACVPTKSIQNEQTNPGNTVSDNSSGQVLTEGFKPSFKLIQEVAKRSPPVIFGKIKNVGNATGSVKVTAKVYYAKVVSGEGTQTFNDVKPGEELDYNIPINDVSQWTSYKVYLEELN